MIKEMIGRIVEGGDLSFEESKTVMKEIMEGVATEVQIGSFVTALRMKGETVEWKASQQRCRLDPLLPHYE